MSNLLRVPELRDQTVSAQRELEAWVLLHSTRHAPIPVTGICPQMSMIPRWRNALFRPQLPLCLHLFICYYNQPHAQCAFKLGMAAHTYGPSSREAETEGLQNRPAWITQRNLVSNHQNVSTTTRILKKTREMAQWVKSSWPKSGNPSLNPQNPHTIQTRSSKVCHPSALKGRWETRESGSSQAC